MHRQWIITIVALITVFGAVFGAKWFQTHRAANAGDTQGPPPAAVETIVAKADRWDPDLRVVGSLAAVDGTHITAQIAGNITEITFTPGTAVSKGALLARLDDTTELAQLHADEARLALARTTLTRARSLFATKATSESALQSAEADHESALAAVEGDRAVLAKLRITAPFSGVVGIREASLGQYVSPGTPIVRLESLDPLFLNFALPQDRLRELAPGNAVRFVVDAYPGETFHGRITALDSAVDAQTRNIAVQATVRNPDGRLRPGLYGTVSISIGAKIEGVSLPETAIAYSTFGNIVYVVEGPGASNAAGAEGTITHRPTVRARVVTIVANRDGRVLVSEGVTAGDVVVSAGQNKLRDGAPVAIRNADIVAAGDT